MTSEQNDLALDVRIRNLYQRALRCADNLDCLQSDNQFDLEDTEFDDKENFDEFWKQSHTRLLMMKSQIGDLKEIIKDLGEIWRETRGY